MTDLASLIERLERATGPDRELDLTIQVAIYPDGDIAKLMQFRRGLDGKIGMAWDIWGNSGSVVFEKRDAHGNCYFNGGYPLPNYTSSIDAAMTLVPDGCSIVLNIFDVATKPERIHTARVHISSFRVRGEWSPGVLADSATPAIALCIAALRARPRKIRRREVMSNFEAPAFNPASVAVENATWRDDHFGRHEYGVVFADGTVYRPEQVGIEACASALTSLTRQLEELRDENERLKAERDKWDRRIAYDELAARADALARELEASEERGAVKDEALFWAKRFCGYIVERRLTTDDQIEQAEFLRAELDAIFSHLTSPSDVLDRVRTDDEYQRLNDAERHQEKIAQMQSLARALKGLAALTAAERVRPEKE